MKNILFFACLLALTACNKKNVENQSAASATSEPTFIEVQHILIGFEGSVPGKAITRKKEEAEKLANEILAKAKAGEDFLKLVQQYTDDQAPGIYGMTNVGAAPQDGAYPREHMVPAFGDVGFKLNAGDVGLANFDPNTSPYGFHVIKRVK